MCAQDRNSDVPIYCRFCGGIIHQIGGPSTRQWVATDKRFDWCKHWPEGERKLN